MSAAQDYGERIVDVYDAWYDSVLPSDETADFLCALAPGGTFLELGVGTGRVALRVAQRGGEVTGVDLSESMLRRLGEKDSAGLVKTHLMDMSESSTLGTFSVVYCVFNTLAGLASWEAQLRTFKAAAKSINKDGCFVVEQQVPTMADLAMSGELRVIAVGPDWMRASAEVVDEETQLIDIQIMELRSPGSVEFYPAKVRYMTDCDIAAAAVDAGLELCHSFVDWTGTEGAGAIKVFRLK